MEKQRWEESEKRREEERRSEKRKSQKKEDAGAWKGRKVAIQCVFPMICGSGGLKRRLAKAAGAEPAGQMIDENLHAVVARSTFPTQNVQRTSCSKHFGIWWRKSALCCGAKHIIAHFRVKIYKTHQRRTTFRSCDVEKVHAFMARSTFRSQNVQSTSVRAVLEVEVSKKCTPLWRAAHFQVKTLKAPHVRPLLDVQMPFRVAGARDCAPCQKWETREYFAAVSKVLAGVGRLKRICKDAFSRGRRSTRDMFIRDVRRSGCWFPQRGCILEHQIFSFGKMILCDRCSTSYDLASLFPGRRSTLETWTGNIAKRIGTRPSALHSAFHYWRRSCRIVFDVVNFKNWGSLADLLRFDTIKFTSWGGLAELLQFLCCQFEYWGGVVE